MTSISLQITPAIKDTEDVNIRSFFIHLGLPPIWSVLGRRCFSFMLLIFNQDTK
jgi:hypothetical protein